MKGSRVTMLAAGAAVSLATLAAIAQLGAANPQAKLADDVRRATAAYQDAALAEKAGYGAFLGCVAARRRARWACTMSTATT